jgi:hypothetical protein
LPFGRSINGKYYPFLPWLYPQPSTANIATAWLVASIIVLLAMAAFAYFTRAGLVRCIVAVIGGFLIVFEGPYLLVDLAEFALGVLDNLLGKLLR